jgi:hypothetical protein
MFLAYFLDTGPPPLIALTGKYRHLDYDDFLLRALQQALLISG